MSGLNFYLPGPGRIKGLVLLILPVLACAAQAHADTSATVDSLLSAGRYDAADALIPPLLERARTEGDSTAVARLLILRGRIELYRDAVEAERTLEEARRVAEAARDTAGWSDALGFKSIATTYLGRYDESIALNRSRLALTLGSGDAAGEAWSRIGLGYAYLKTGDFDSARAEYSKAAEVFGAGGRPGNELTALVGLGRSLNALGETDSAREVYLRVWRSSREIGDLPHESDALNNLGNLEYNYGDMAVAAGYFERAYELNRSIGNPRGTVIPATNVALSRSYLGQYSDAALILSNALAICEENGYRDLTGMVISTLGQVRLSQGRPNEAAVCYRRVLSLEKGLTRKQRDDAVFGLARALAAADSAEAAASVLGEALAKGALPEFEPVMGQFLSRCLRRAGRQREALERAKEAAISAGRVGSHETRFASALELSAAFHETGDLPSSYDWYLRAVAVLERFRESTGEHEWREAHGRIRDLVEGGRVLLEYPPDLGYGERVEALFHVLQRFKARTLAERIVGTRASSAEGPPPDNRAIEPAGLTVLMDGVLEPGELLLDFAVGNSTSFLFAVTGDSCRLIMLPGRDSSLPGKISFYLESLGQPPQDGGVSRVAAGEIGHMGSSVYRILLGGVDDLVRRADRMIISPDAFISAIPFGALPLPGGKSRTLLMDRAEIEYVPSATLLAWLRSRPERERVTSGENSVLALVPRGNRRMKGVIREVAWLGERLGGVRVIEGRPDSSLFRRGPPGFEVLHVAAHFVANHEKPWFSGILLEPDDGGTDGPFQSAGQKGRGIESSVPVDPYLRAGEIAGRSIPARLAVLSGCESALGRTSSGEGVLGLTSGFLSAGVPAVVSTSWPVDDEVTADLMAVFYDRLAEGEPVASALRRAKTAVRSEGSTSHPFYWAGFVIAGDGSRTVNVRSSARIPSAGVLTASLFIISILVVLSRMLAASMR